MQPAVSYPRRSLHTASTFINHLPRSFEIAAPDQSVWPADSMIVPTGMTAFGSGLTFPDAGMGQGHSTPDWRYKAGASLPDDNAARVDRYTVRHNPTPRLSDDDTWSMQYDCANQTPYSSTSRRERSNADEMMTQNSFLTLPKDNASHDLAFFLRTTGPIASHQRPSGVGDRTSAPSHSSKNAFALFRRSQRRSKSSSLNVLSHNVPKKETCLTGVPEDLRVLNKALRDEGGLLKDAGPSSRVPRGVLEKVSTTGKKYYALQIPSTVSEETKTPDIEPTARNDVWDSHIAVSFGDDVRTEDVLDNWLMSLSREDPDLAPLSPPRKSSAHLPMDIDRIRVASTSPIRPAASNPPTPVPLSPASFQSPSVRSKKHPHLYVPARILPRDNRAIHPMPKLSLPKEEFPVKHPSAADDVDIRQPTPRQLGSHPVLLKDAVHASHTYTRSVSDSPGPPPRSPLRTQHGSNTVEDVLDQRNRGREITPRMAPKVLEGRQCSGGARRMRPTVVTDCTGPIKRPKSRSSDVQQRVESRKEREARIRARKLRDRPSIASIVQPSVSNSTGSHKLKKHRQQAAQMPELRPQPLHTRNASPTPSETSFKKVTESTRTPVAPSSPREEEVWHEMKRYRTPDSSVLQPTSHFSPISPTKSVVSQETSMTLSPVMLVAESAPPPKSRSTHKPPRLIIKESRQYAPRPRSASMKRRSRGQAMTPPRASTPISSARALLGEEVPSLPSPPPSRALPPTPPQSSSHKNQHSQRQNSVRERGSGIDARLEALEKQNALLSAALMAVLKTNGAYNLPQLPTVDGSETASIPKSQGPTAWEHRIARRSAASHAASSSNGSALEMYMSTRRGDGGRGAAY